ncbi:MAG: PBP1A family penicillin-binding protein, partial [Elusimicrobiota bacterium]|nr:PBP1A family penicillin-binding protein [Elusimicrobiota bacterium]
YKIKELKELSSHRLFLRFVYLVAIISSIVIISSSLLMRKILSDIPSIDKLDEYTPSLTTYVYDVNEEIIAELSVERRAFLPLNKIPVDLQNAVIAMEDHNFFKHWGISPKGIMRALMRDIMHRRAAQGGSTITQQLSKLIFLTPEKTITRKIKEMFLSIQIERNFSKQEILQMYLNQIYWGGGVYGVQAAAKLYFDKDVSQMTLADCSLLAGLVASPGTYSPFKHPKRAKHRRSLVLNRMLAREYISHEEMDEVVKSSVPVEKSSMFTVKAPYFVEHIRRKISDKYGSAQLWKGGMKIYTTLDMSIQKVAEEEMEKQLKYRDEEQAKYVARHSTSDNPLSTATLQGAFVMLDVKTGAIRAMIGGRDYEKSEFNRATQNKRQAGSTFKPFVWMSALKSGYTPSTIVEDSPLAFYYDGKDWRLLEGATDSYSIDMEVQQFIGDKDFKIWVPTNYSDKFLGRLPLRRALELSRNLVSVFLVNRVGPTLVVDVAHKAGIKSYLAPVPSIGLGTSLVTTLEMASAFGTFANSGIHTDPFAIIKIINSKGKILESHIPYEEERFSPQNSFVLVNMMKGVVERGTGIYTKRLGIPLAGKTGTSQEAKDLWFIGMTPDLVAAGWVGYDDYSFPTLKHWTGGGMVAPWWTPIMKEALKDKPVSDFFVPEDIVFVTIDPTTGKLALPTCKKKFLEAFVKGTEPQEFCDVEH